MLARPAVLALTVALTLLAGRADAQSAEDKAQARDLGVQGLDALDHKDWTKAEDRLRRADALYHVPTITLNLARAQAHLGHFVESWESYHRIVLEGAPAGANATIRKAVRDAQAEIASVEGRRAGVTIRITGADRFEAMLDGSALSSAALGAERKVNPGTHLLHASASGYLPVDTTFTLGEGQTSEVSVSLKPEPQVAPPPVIPILPVALAPPAAAPQSAEPGPRSTPSHALAYAAFGVGVIGLATGVVGSIVAMNDHNYLEQNPCPATCSTQQAGAFNDKLGSYHTISIVSSTGFLVGGVGAIAGVVLLLTSPGAPDHGSASVQPYLGVGTVGAVGTF